MKLAWMWNRLRAMSAPEILHRLARLVGQRVEQLLVAVGWQPRPAQRVGTRTLLFPESDEWRQAWHSSFELDEARLSKMIDGEVYLFAYDALPVGRPVDWHRNPLTGQTSPRTYGKGIDYRDDRQVGDIKVLWELGRHQHLISLAVACAVTGERRYQDALVEQIDEWVEDNPFGIGIHWCSALEVGLRLIAWSIVHSLLALAGHEKGLFSVVARPDALGTSVYQQAWFVRHYLSRHSSANNHLVGELCGLWVACQVFDLGPQGERWADLARVELEEEARAQVHPDGVNKEQATYYHLWVLEYLLVAWLVGERAGKPFTEEYRRRLLAMSEFLTDISLGDGGPPQIGDADDGFVARFEPAWPEHPYNDVQAAVATVFGAPQTSSGQPPTHKAFWYGFVAGREQAGAAASPAVNRRERPIVYPHGGYAVLGDDDVKLVFDAGPLGYRSIAAHGHADALSVCLGIDQAWWLVDPGTYAYHSDGDWRDYFRSTSAHNTLTVDGTNQSEIGGNFLWLRKAEATLEGVGRREDGTQWVRGSHDGYSDHGIVHRREVLYRAGQFEIIDQLLGDDAAASAELAVYFHFAPDIEVAGEENRWVATRPGSGHRLKFDLDPACSWSVAAGQTDPIQGWYSAMIGTKVPAPVLVGRRSGIQSQTLKAVIAVA